MDQLAVDGWLREHGLPTLVPARRWADDLPRRVAPLQVFLSGLVIGIGLLVWAVDGFTVEAQRQASTNQSDTVADLPELVALIVIGLVVLAVPAVLAALTHRWLQRLPGRRATPTAWAVNLGSATAGVVTGRLVDPLSSWWAEVGTAVISLVGAALFVWVGGSALLLWTLRAALHNLGAVKQMASLALPVILLVVIFSLFSTELWQMTDTLSWGRLSLVGLVLALMGTVAVLPAIGRSALGAPTAIGDDERRRLLTRFGLPPAAPAARALSWLQRANVVLVMVAAQLLLGGVFAIAQAALLMLLGGAALTQETVTTWLGHPEVTARVGRTVLPWSVNLLKTSILLAMIATLSFVISAVNDARYREHFFDPILREVREALTVGSARPR